MLTNSHCCTVISDKALVAALTWCMHSPLRNPTSSTASQEPQSWSPCNTRTRQGHLLCKDNTKNVTPIWGLESPGTIWLSISNKYLQFNSHCWIISHMTQTHNPSTKLTPRPGQNGQFACLVSTCPATSEMISEMTCQVTSTPPYHP